VDHKASVRSEVFAVLRTVALPDSRFHFDFGEFIADFQGSDAANQRLIDHRHYQDARVIFITPDNCLEQLRHRALLDGKTVLTTSYSIKRGFWVLKRADIAHDKLLYASTLDGMERVARQVTLQEIAAEIGHVDFLVTGTGAINEQGVRFGKGHGFFDAEWGMLHRMGIIRTTTPAAAVVHDCQVLQQTLHPEIFDTVADVIFTPTRTLEVDAPHKPECGIVWSRLDPHMFATIPPLQELKDLEVRGVIPNQSAPTATRQMRAKEQ
jgi:5-formyltetrahydrofolate cyclo-ligase